MKEILLQGTQLFALYQRHQCMLQQLQVHSDLPRVLPALLLLERIQELLPWKVCRIYSWFSWQTSMLTSDILTLAWLVAEHINTFAILKSVFPQLVEIYWMLVKFAAWNALWPRERKRQRAFFLFGLELILQLDTAGVRDFFCTFFQLPEW